MHERGVVGAKLEHSAAARKAHRAAAGSIPDGHDVAASIPAARRGEPTFALAENIISLRDVGQDEQLRPEVVDVIRLTDERIIIRGTVSRATCGSCVICKRPTAGLLTYSPQVSGAPEIEGLRASAHADFVRIAGRAQASEGYAPTSYPATCCG